MPDAQVILQAFEARMELAKYASDILPNSPHCYCCGLPSGIVEMKATQYNPGKYMAPLCTLCYKSLTPQTRLEFYREQYKDQEMQCQIGWQLIEQIVIAGG